MEWPSRPFVRIFIFFVAGILTAGMLPAWLPLSYSSLYVLFLVMTGVVFLAALYFKSYRFRWLTGIFFGGAIFLSGLILTVLHKEREATLPDVNKSTYWRVEVASEPVVKQKSVRIVGLMRPLSSGQHRVQSKSIKGLLIFERDSLANTLEPGNFLLVYVKPVKPSDPGNPMAFSYKKFLAERGIFYTGFVSSGNWIKTNAQAGGIVYTAMRLRRLLLGVLQENGLSGKEYAVAAAVLLGYNRLMDRETEAAYAAAGAVHVLCVSGLHVGIIYLVFGFLLSFIGAGKRQRQIKALVLLTVIWFYALLTGLSPSVSRASVMISLFVIGENLQRDKDRFNTLAASAFLLLAINPSLIHDVGFQLSYSAVTGILLLYQPLYGVLYVKNRILDLLWSVMVLSLSAQAGAFPVAAHYFHTFPLYFLLTNLLVFGLAYLVVVLGMVFVIFSPFKWVAFYLGKALFASLYLMNYLVNVVATFPHAQIANLYVPWFKVLLLYALMALLLLWIFKRNGVYFIGFLSVFLLLLSYNTWQKFQRYQRKEMVVYRLNRGIALDIIRGEDHLFLADSLSITSRRSLDYATKEYHLSCGLTNEPRYMEHGPYKRSFAVYRSGFFCTKALSGYVLNKKERALPHLVHEKPKIDYLIINAPYGNSLSELLHALEFKRVVLANNPTKAYRNKIWKEAKELHIPVYDMEQKGCFMVSP